MCVGTTILIKMGKLRYAWVTALPLLWDAAVTLTASWMKIFSPDPGLGFFAQRSAAQEALANVRKHAAASHVRLRLTYEGTGATVEVRDDGRGFDLDGAEGFGLRGMGARAAAVGGRLQVDSTPGGGTVVALSVP